MKQNVSRIHFYIRIDPCQILLKFFWIFTLRHRTLIYMENTECKSLGSNSKSMRSMKINLQLSIQSCSLNDPPEKWTYKGNDGTVYDSHHCILLSHKNSSCGLDHQPAWVLCHLLSHVHSYWYQWMMFMFIRYFSLENVKQLAALFSLVLGLLDIYLYNTYAMLLILNYKISSVPLFWRTFSPAPQN